MVLDSNKGQLGEVPPGCLAEDTEAKANNELEVFPCDAWVGKRVLGLEMRLLEVRRKEKGGKEQETWWKLGEWERE